jgi:hypothetical protein
VLLSLSSLDGMVRSLGSCFRPEIKAKWTAAKLGWRHG